MRSGVSSGAIVYEDDADGWNCCAAAATSELGHPRQFGDVGGMSAIPPIATKLVRGGERRKGPNRRHSGEYLDRRACRSKMRDCRDEEKKGRDRRHQTVNAEGMYECDLQVHEIDREAHA